MQQRELSGPTKTISCTLNLLRSSRVNPKLSAYAYIIGNYNVNAHPLAPPGTRVVLHKKSDQRDSWEYHGVEAFIVGPSLNHYCCFQSLTHTDAVQIILHTIPIPAYNDATAVRQAILVILYIIKHSKETNIPELWRGDAIKRVFEQLVDAINQKDIINTPVVALPIVSKPEARSPPSAVSPTIRPVTPTPNPSVPLLPPLPPYLHASLPRMAPAPRVVHPTPCYPSTANNWRAKNKL